MYINMTHCSPIMIFWKWQDAKRNLTVTLTNLWLCYEWWESDIDLGESDSERETSDSDIVDYESQDIVNETNILTNTGTAVTENSDNEQEFQVLPSFATDDAHTSLQITLSQLYPHLCQIVILCHNH